MKIESTISMLSEIAERKEEEREAERQRLDALQKEMEAKAMEEYLRKLVLTQAHARRQDYWSYLLIYRADF